MLIVILALNKSLFKSWRKDTQLNDESELLARSFFQRPGVSFTGQGFHSQARGFIHRPGVLFIGQGFRSQARGFIHRPGI